MKRKLSDRTTVLAFFESVFAPLQLRNRQPAYQDQFRTAIAWLDRALGRTSRLADFQRSTLVTVFDQLADVGLGHHRVCNIRKRLIAVWGYAASLSLAAPYDPPPATSGRKALPPAPAWQTLAPEPGTLLAYYRDQYRPQARAVLPGNQLAMYDMAINHYHEMHGRRVLLDEVTPDAVDAFFTWLDGRNLAPSVRRMMRACLRRIMRSYDPNAWPVFDGMHVRRPILEHEAGQEPRRTSRRRPPLDAAPGTLAHFFETVYVPEATAHCTEAYRGELRCGIRRLRQALGRDVALAELSRQTIVQFVAWLNESGISTRRAKHVRNLVLTVWRYAAELEQAPPVPTFRKWRIAQEEPDAWSLDEATRIVAAAGEFRDKPIGWSGKNILATDYMVALLLVGWYTALRRGSLLSIRTADVNFEQGTVYLQGSRFKSRRGKQYRLGADCLAAIAKIHDPARELLFPPPAETKALGDYFKEILAFARVEKGDRLRNSLFHKWRRTVATHTAVRAGIAAAATLLTHGGSAITVARYIDPSYLVENDATRWLPQLGVDTSVAIAEGLAREN